MSLECRICNVTVANMKALREHFKQSPNCQEEVELQDVRRFETEHDLADSRKPATRYNAARPSWARNKAGLE